MLDYITDLLEYIGNIFEATGKNKSNIQKIYICTFIGISLLITSILINVFFLNK